MPLSVEVGKAEVLSLEVVEDALVPVDHVIEVTLSVVIFEDTPPPVDCVSSVALSGECVEDTAISVEADRGLVTR